MTLSWCIYLLIYEKYNAYFDNVMVSTELPPKLNVKKSSNKNVI